MNPISVEELLALPGEEENLVLAPCEDCNEMVSVNSPGVFPLRQCTHTPALREKLFRFERVR